MDKKLILVLILILTFLSACQNQELESASTDTEEEISVDATNSGGTPEEPTESANLPYSGAFEIYLISDRQITGPDVPFYELDALPLAEAPIISAQDLIRYNWEFHSFEVKEEIYAQVMALFSQHVPMSGLPFVIQSNGERIYAGAFWSPASSLHFGGVVIMQPFDPAGGPLLITLGYPNDSYFMGEDPRSDPRIMEALEEAGVLE